MKVRHFNIIFCLLLFLAIFLLSERNIKAMKHLFGQVCNEKEHPVVVIDAGHGGFDPGKIGVNNILEKDVNLAISQQLKQLLEQNDIKVVMTRDSDEGLYSDSDSNKKASDLKKRVEIINNSEAAVVVSIHQNSFTQESSHGAQVFYYTSQEEGKRFANIMQVQLKSTIKDDNHRIEKANDSYFLLKKANPPIIIVECGFLSNYKEAELLSKDDYQRKLAWAIHLGILKYLNEQEAATSFLN